MGKLEELKDTVGKSKCEKCGFTFPVEELMEEPGTGLVVDQKCMDEVGFKENKQDSSRDSSSHHFTT